MICNVIINGRWWNRTWLWGRYVTVFRPILHNYTSTDCTRGSFLMALCQVTGLTDSLWFLKRFQLFSFCTYINQSSLICLFCIDPSFIISNCGTLNSRCWGCCHYFITIYPSIRLLHLISLRYLSTRYRNIYCQYMSSLTQRNLRCFS